MTAGPTGSIKLVQTNHHETDSRDMINVRSEVLALGATDPRQRYQVDFQVKGSLKEDDKLQLFVKADSAGEVDNTSTILIPVLFRDLTNGHEWPTFLTAADFGITATDIATPAGEWKKVGEYVIPAQTALKLGHPSPINSLAYISLAYTNDA